MKEYHKIQTVFLRSPESNYKNLMEGEWATPEFKELQDITWVWTEKIDGTNIRIMFDGENVRFGGKTDDAQMPTFLLKVLQDTFTVDKMKAVFPEATDVCLYGEGYGAKIQKGGNYLPDRTSFILFDVKIGSWWLEKGSIDEIAINLGTQIVPTIGEGPLCDAIELVKRGFTSTIAHNTSYMAEGLVMKPKVTLFNRKGERIVAKIKHRDFIATQSK
jgi:hypothetical protein